MSFLNTVPSFTIKSLKLLVAGIFAVTAAVGVRNILHIMFIMVWHLKFKQMAYRSWSWEISNLPKMAQVLSGHIWWLGKIFKHLLYVQWQIAELSYCFSLQRGI